MTVTDIDLDAIEARRHADVAAYGAEWYRTDVPALVAALREARAEVERLRDDLSDAVRGLDAYVGANGASVAERDDWRRRYEALRADYNHLNERLDFAVETGSKMIKRYEALRDGVTGLCDDPDPDTDDGMTLISVDAIRAVVARVEGDES